MERTLAKNIFKKTGQQVILRGWLYNLRLLGKINFLLLKDRSGTAQIVIQDVELLKKVKNLQVGSVLKVTGRVQASAKNELNAEIVEPQIDVEVTVTDIPPLEYNKPDLHADLDTVLDYRPLSLRNNKIQAIFRVQAGILKAFTNSMAQLGFMEFRTPLLIGVHSESGADVFEVKYFEDKAYLAQSPQIYKQIMVGAFERVYTIATVFRAEKHNTSRHLMEITQLDGEMAFIDSYDDVLIIVEQLIRDVFNYLRDNHQEDLALWNATLPKLPEGRFPKIKVRDALELIEKRTGKSAQRENLDVDPDDERELGKWVLEEHNSDFLWLLNFKKNKNFYTWNNPENPEESLSYDLECRGLEWLSGTHRIHDFQELLKRFKAQGLTESNYRHYFQAFKFGMPPEAGFSLGLERMTQQIFQLKNIREATLFPSDLKRVAGEGLSQKIYTGQVLYEKIISLLQQNNLEYQLMEHEEVITSEQASQVRGTRMSEGIKAMILKGKKTGKLIMVCIPSDQKINLPSLADKLGEHFELADPEVINKNYGIDIGGVPPFGNLLGLPTYFTSEITNEPKAAFNCGLKTKSIIMNSKDLVNLVNPEI
ncbi:MAG TPA: aspartate--tRNA(Asn) ligase, partial [Candidatus Dojkabacteria bacterium]|nr:aspartate--tRNA(Asn) ligase [Candidatus Dojkabacteria bacterium]